MKVITLMAFLAIFLSACSSTRIASSWRDPDTRVDLEKLSKVLVVALMRDESSRRAAEDEMAARLKGKGVVSYSYLGEEIKTLSEDQIRDKLRADHFDGAITMRLVDVDKDVDYTPGTFSSYPVYYRTFGGYIRRGWVYYSTPDRYTTTRTYSVETNIYSIRKDKIIWTSLTETTDPGGVTRLTADIANTIYKKMKKEGFISN